MNATQPSDFQLKLQEAVKKKKLETGILREDGVRSFIKFMLDNNITVLKNRAPSIIEELIFKWKQSEQSSS